MSVIPANKNLEDLTDDEWDAAVQELADDLEELPEHRQNDLLIELAVWDAPMSTATILDFCGQALNELSDRSE